MSSTIYGTRSRQNHETSSWDDGHFTLANIPWGIASSTSSSSPRMVTRLHNNVYFLVDLVASGLISGLDSSITATFNQPHLNAFAALPASSRLAVRNHLQDVFATSDEAEREILSQHAHPIATIAMHLPVSVGDFSDFSTSVSHVLNAGEAVFGRRTLPPAFLHFPVGYAGRSSTIVASGMSIPRPSGIRRDHVTGDICFGQSQALDFELEIGVIVSKPTRLGERVLMEDADAHIFGLVILNDWSARDIQGFEMNPLGPFNGKSFGTTISQWVIALEALKPFEVASTSIMPSPDELSDIGLNETPPRAEYLRNAKAVAHYDIHLQVDLVSPKVEGTADPAHPRSQSTATTVCQTNLSSIYWSIRDMLVHQTISGCALNTGDLLATGTVSGPSQDSFGCLLEKTQGGKRPFKLTDGSERRYLMDEDGVLMTGYAGRLGSEDCVGFGACWGSIGVSHI